MYKNQDVINAYIMFCFRNKKYARNTYIQCGGVKRIKKCNGIKRLDYGILVKPSNFNYANLRLAKKLCSSIKCIPKAFIKDIVQGQLFF